MPSHLHEALLLLFRNRPSLAPALLRDTLHVDLPAYSEARLDSAELTDIQPAEYRADLVVLLLQDKPVLGMADPELAVLSAMAHGRDPDTERSVRIALAAQMASIHLDADRSALYVDLILNSLSEAARRRLQAMDPVKYEYQSDFARHYFSKGRVEGETAGRAAIVTRQLLRRFGSLSDLAQRRISKASVAELDAIADRLLNATTLDEAVGDL